MSGADASARRSWSPATSRSVAMDRQTARSASRTSPAAAASTRLPRAETSCMASSKDFVYATARKALNKAQINLSSVTIGAALVSSTYSPAPASDQYLSGIPAAAILAQVDLTGTTVSASGWLQGTIPQFL